MSRNRQFLVSMGLLALVAVPAHAQYTFTRIAKVGDTVPGAGVATFSGFVGTPSVSSGNIALLGAWSGNSEQGIFANFGGGGLTDIAKTGDLVPSGGGSAFTGFGRAPGISGNTLSLFGTWAGTEQGIFKYSGGTLNNVVKTGDLAPSGGGATFSAFGDGPNVSGSNIAFRGTFGVNQGIFVNGGGGTSNFVKTGDLVPGAGAATFTTFGAAPGISNSNIVFTGNWAGSNQGIFTNVGGFTSLASTVSAVPGVGGSTFTGFGATPTISGSNIAFLGTWASAQGIFFSSGGGAPTLLAKTGDAVPGVGGATFASFGAGSSIGGNNMVVSGSNVAFIGTWSGGGQGLFISSGAGSPTLVLKNGDTLFGSTIVSLGFGGGGLENPQLAFRYTLANGETGIAASLATAPEPGTLALGLLGLSGLFLRRRKQA